ncbi:copper chaperone PCu(A)C [Collimonas sp.]|jgi:copper(I)-binding protein|uniref:copper chaperone PCu(A)C n=1 Tax=Collimonas sp. TaxID=1963772 RepID=UPI002B632F96|nr:copper chaperone PCu(A)C [Collimonas sp.]HWW06412.1 copper chaperone PCu(A)C [Collimonas sp.]
MSLRSVSLFFCALAISVSAYAHEYQLGSLHIDHPYARATVPGQPAGGAFLSIENSGKESDKLIGVSSLIAKSTEIHTMSMEGNVMKMREVGEIELLPASKVDMTPGHGYHIMLIGLTQPLKAGDKFPLTLTFQKAGKIEVSVFVTDLTGKPADAAHQH